MPLPGQPAAPRSILDSLVIIDVPYWDLRGLVPKEGQIVVADEIVDTIGGFFDMAYKLRFPMGPVVPANNYDFRGVDTDDQPIIGLSNDDKRLMYNNITSGFNFRTIAGSNTHSKHSLGLAIDVNPRLNRYSRYQRTENGIMLASEEPANFIDEPGRPGTFYAKHPLVEYMLKRNMVWGGLWSKEKDLVIDRHHFGHREY